MKYSKPLDRASRDRRFLSVIYYEGPWERMSNLAYGMRPDGSLRWDIPADPRGWRRVLRLLEVIGNWADRRDRSWHDYYVNRGVKPPRRWKRRMDNAAPEA